MGSCHNSFTVEQIGRIPKNVARIRESHLSILKPPLGKGAWGIVSKARLTRKGKSALGIQESKEDVVCVKSVTDINMFLREVQIYADLLSAPTNCDYILRIMGVSTTKPFFVLEYFNGISLEQLIRSNVLHNTHRIWYALQLARALRYLHSMQIMHGDVKPGNILINTSTNHLKLIDFGIASNLSRETIQANGAGTPAYTGPERYAEFNKRRYKIGLAADIFALGIVLVDLFQGNGEVNPRRRLPLDELLMEYGHEKYFIPRAMGEFSSDLATLTGDCINPIPNDRPLIDAVCLRLEDIIRNLLQKS